MKIVNLIGGLGNQMFQYAFALALKHRHPGHEVKIDTSHFNYLFFKKYRASNLHNGFEMEDVFPNAKLEQASCLELMKLTWYMPNYWLSRIVRMLLPKRKHEFIQSQSEIFKYDPDILNAETDGYYEGVWQAAQYLVDAKDEIMETYAHPAPNEYNQNLISEIQNCNSVGIHVRRGDYEYAKDFNGICTLEYYQKAIKEILKEDKNYVFYVFSNDIKWCNDNLASLVNGHKIVYVTENKGADSCWDMFLMTYCKDLIIANSSFSWWGAFLNKGVNRVVAPYPWVNRNCPLDNYLSSWIRIS